MPGTLFVVATPIGNLDDISVRALRVLREAAIIAAEDTRRTARLLTRYGITTKTTSLHEHNEHQKAAALVARLTRGDAVALVSDAGTPGVSDPGQHLIRQAIEAGIRVEAIPGPSAVLAALSASGLPNDRFTFLGFPPTRSKDRSIWFNDLKSAGHTVVFFEAPHRAIITLQELLTEVGDLTVAVGRELTKAHEEWVRGPISAVLGRISPPLGEFTVVVDVGHMADIDRPNIPDDNRLALELGELTESTRFTRRQAISELARRHRLPPNRVYAAVERAKKLAE